MLRVWPHRGASGCDRRGTEDFEYCYWRILLAYLIAFAASFGEKQQYVRPWKPTRITWRVFVLCLMDHIDDDPPSLFYILLPSCSFSIYPNPHATLTPATPCSLPYVHSFPNSFLHLFQCHSSLRHRHTQPSTPEPRHHIFTRVNQGTSATNSWVCSFSLREMRKRKWEGGRDAPSRRHMQTPSHRRQPEQDNAEYYTQPSIILLRYFWCIALYFARRLWSEILFFKVTSLKNYFHGKKFISPKFILKS